MTSQHSVLMTPHSAYVWHTFHCRLHRIHSFTPNQIIYDVTSISGMTLHPLYSCHHIQDTCHCIHCSWTITYNLLIISLYQTKPQYLWCQIHFKHDITPPVSDSTPTVSLSSQPLHWYHTHFWMTSHPPSVWHHMHYMEHHIQSLCPHTTVLMTSQPLYMKPHPVCTAAYTLYMRPHSHSLCPHTHCLDNITLTLFMTSHSPYVWHRLHYTRHHINTLWPQTNMFFSSHPLYWTSCPLYLCHHFHCIDDITQTVFLRSHPL